jgi:hypothetical protein
LPYRLQRALRLQSKDHGARDATPQTQLEVSVDTAAKSLGVSERMVLI